MGPFKVTMAPGQQAAEEEERPRGRGSLHEVGIAIVPPELWSLVQLRNPLPQALGQRLSHSCYVYTIDSSDNFGAASTLAQLNWGLGSSPSVDKRYQFGKQSEKSIFRAQPALL